jgi:hypothetical protein
VIEVLFGGSDQAVIEAISAKIEEVTEAVATELDAQGALTVAYIVSEELHGQVLNQRSGKLAGSIRAIPAVVDGTSVVANVEGAGGPAWYGRLFEEGGTGPFEIVPKTAKALRFVAASGEVVFAKKVQHPGLPDRPFMDPAQAARTPEIVAGVERAIGEVLAK